MKRYISSSSEIFGMANLSMKRTGLPVVIWSDHQGVSRSLKHSIPRLKIGRVGEFDISVSISSEPKILAKSSGITQSQLKLCKSAIQYVADNYDLFLKHYNDTNEEFDDEDLYEALRERGCFH